MDFFIWWIKLIYPVQGDEKSGPDYSLTQRFFPSSQVSIAVGLAGFACVLLLVIFVLINKYGRRSKFGMKGKSPQVDRQADSSVSSAFLPVASLCRKPVPPANRLTSKPQRIRNCTYTATSLYFYCTLATSPGLVLKKKRTWMGLWIADCCRSFVELHASAHPHTHIQTAGPFPKDSSHVNGPLRCTYASRVQPVCSAERSKKESWIN